MGQPTTHTEALELSKGERALLSVLVYFDVFDYPLKPTEIHRFSPVEMSAIDVVPHLNFLANNGVIKQEGAYFGLRVDREQVERRQRGAIAAERMMKHARRFTRLMSCFPYVRGICISGSLSKGYSDESGDIDYFVITKPGRLWMARTCLLAFKKIFLLNRKKYFCVNYLIDTEHLEIPDKNAFTATEIQTLIPTHGLAHYRAFVESNAWVRRQRPQFTIPAQEASDFRETPRPWIRPLLEVFFNNALGDWIDRKCMAWTMHRWQRKFGTIQSKDFELTMRSRKYVSKHHPQNFQSRVLKAIAETQQKLEVEFGIKLS